MIIEKDFSQLSAKAKFGNIGNMIDHKMEEHGRKLREGVKKSSNANGEPTCPNCGATGDFFDELNAVVKNCVDFCEFPHRCVKPDGTSYIMWKTLADLQIHAEFHCPKFGCDICLREEF